jgi:hypothetical protein
MSTGAPCPVCGAPGGSPFVTIRDAPVHCNVLWATAGEARAAPRGDLDLVFCDTCGHVHNASFDDARTTYGATYENSLHHSAVFQTYASALVADLVERHDLHDRDIVEVGAGQGDFLEMLCRAGGNRGTGFDPSHVTSGSTAESGSAGIALVAAFYSEEFADYPADLIVCRHVLEHIGASGDFVGMIRRVIGARPTVAFFEVPDALWTIRHGGIWDLIYEHCGYFTPPSLEYVFRHGGFDVTRTNNVFGGQFLTIEAVPAGGPTALAGDHRAEVAAIAADVDRFAVLYASAVNEWRDRLTTLTGLGRRAVIWGAGSKGVSFLNEVDTDGAVELAVDINPRKHGMHISGAGQEIVGPDALVAYRPDVVIVMNPNYRDEIAVTLAGLDVGAELIVVSSG